jgi:hypothetical protein
MLKRFSALASALASALGLVSAASWQRASALALVSALASV